MQEQSPDDYDFPAVRKAIDSTFMLVLARFLMPIVVAVIGYLMTTTLDDVKKANIQMQTRLEHLWETQASANVTTATLAGKVDGATRQLDRLQAQVDSFAKR